MTKKSTTTKKQTTSIAIDVSYSAAQNMPVMEREITETSVLSTNTWIPFGSDNLFPNAVAELCRKSPTHRSILNWKTRYCSGIGFVNPTEDKKTQAFIDKANPKESLRAIAKKYFLDRFEIGNVYLEIVLTPKGINLFHKDFTHCRLTKDRKGVQIHKDWININQYEKTTIKTLPLFPNFEKIDGYKRCVLHVKDYEPEYTDYGIPQWIAAMDAAGIAYKTNKWNISRLDNSFNSSGIIVVEGQITPAQAKKLKADFKKEMTGENKQGKMMFVVKQLAGGNTTFTPITQQNEGDWIQLRQESKADLIEANNWFRSLCSFSDNTGFETNRIRNEYQIAMNTIVAEEQEIFFEVLKQIAEIVPGAGLDFEEVNFKNKAPIAMFDFDIDSVLQFNEARGMLGLPVDDLDVRKTKTLSEIRPTKNPL